jgi:hypothetical protein
MLHMNTPMVTAFLEIPTFLLATFIHFTLKTVVHINKKLLGILQTVRMKQNVAIGFLCPAHVRIVNQK